MMLYCTQRNYHHVFSEHIFILRTANVHIGPKASSCDSLVALCLEDSRTDSLLHRVEKKLVVVMRMVVFVFLSAFNEISCLAVKWPWPS